MRSFKKILPYLAITGANLIWGFSFLLQRIGLGVEGSTPTLLLFWRFLIAFAASAVIVLIKRIPLRLRGRDRCGLFLLMAADVFYYLFQIYGLCYTNATLTGLILAVVPVFAIGIAALWLREYPGWIKAFLCLIPIAGVIIITLSGSSLGVATPLGILLLALACLLAAFDRTVNRRISGSFSPEERTFWVMLAQCAAFAVFALMSVRWDFSALLAPWKSTRFTLAVLAMGLFSSAVATLLVNYAAGHLTVMHLSIFGCVSTVFSTLAGVFILHEPMTIAMASGVVLIIAGVWIVSMPANNKKAADVPPSKD